jgi:hypothetical protein
MFRCKKNYAFFVLFLSVVCDVRAQNEHDGILVAASTANGTKFYYGEPFNLYFKFTNTKNSINYYYKPEVSINTRISLRNIQTGKSVRNTDTTPISHYGSARRDIMSGKQPSGIDAYQPNESGYDSYQINEYFGIEKLSDKRLRHNLLIYKLWAVPVGEYEFTFEYDLLPSKKTLKATHRFKVEAVPDKEQNAFRKYIQATEHAAKAHFDGDRNYSASHPDSYDNFIKDYSNSIYANHAYLNMVTESYYYAEGGVTMTDRIEKFKEFAGYYFKLRNDNMKILYVAYLPMFLKLIPGKDVRKELDLFLLKIKDENPEISDMLVSSASFYYKIKGLTNYARSDKR